MINSIRKTPTLNKSKLIIAFAFLLCCLCFNVEAFAKDKLLLAITDFPPYQYIENGEKKGFKLDLLREAAKRADINLQIDFLPWARVLMALEQGYADFTTMYKTPEREKKFFYPETNLFPITIQIFTHSYRDISWSGDFNDLSDLRIGIINQFSYGKAFDQAREKGIFKHIITANSHNNLVDMLANKRIDIIISAAYAVESIIKKEKLGQTIKGLRPTISDADVYNVFTKTRDLTGLAMRLENALQAMKEDGSFSEIIYNSLAQGS